MRCVYFLVFVCLLVLLEATKAEKSEKKELFRKPDYKDGVKLDIQKRGHKHHGKHGHKHHKKHGGHHKFGLGDHKPLSESKDTPAKLEWMKMSNYDTSGSSDACKLLQCKKHHICLLHRETGVAKCIKKKKLRDQMFLGKVAKAKQMEKEETSKYLEDRKPDYVANQVVKEEKPKHHHKKNDKPKEIVETEKVVNAPQMTVKIQQIKLLGKDEAQIAPKQKVCTDQDMQNMGKRLLDWFKVQQERDPNYKKNETEKKKHHHKKHKKHDKKHHKHGHKHHKKAKRSVKKDLEDHCRCQEPVNWEFNMLDTDKSGSLSAKELKDIEDNMFEHCVRPFIDSCDHNKDAVLTHNEWCCCFSAFQPPCFEALKKLPTHLVLGAPRVVAGTFVPTCDQDGYFTSSQCNGSTGECWCVDKHSGHELYGTRKKGNAKCK